MGARVRHNAGAVSPGNAQVQKPGRKLAYDNGKLRVCDGFGVCSLSLPPLSAARAELRRVAV